MNNFNIIISFFMISHSIPFLLTALFMIIENSFYINNLLFRNLIYLGFLSPTFAALFVLYNFYSQEERKVYYLSIFDFKRISWKWYLIIFAFPPLINSFSAIIDMLFTANTFHFNISADLSLFYIIFLFFFGPLPEELGWRGIALPELQKKFSFKVSVLILGFMWASWHLPLFFIEGSYQYQLGLFTPMFWNFFVAIMFNSVIYGLIYNETNKSIFAVILFHYIVNLTGEAFSISTNAVLISTLLKAITAVFILIYYRKSD